MNDETNDTGDEQDGRRSYYPLSELPGPAPINELAWSAGFGPDLDRIFRFYPGQLTVMTGIAGCGKSTLLFNMICRMAKQQGIRSFLYVPENEAYLRETLRKIWNDDRTFEVFAREQCFVRPSRYENGDPPHTMDWVLGESYDAIRWKGIDLVVIDPWNELERCKPKDWLMTDYIGVSLMVAKDFVRSHKIALVVIAHPTKAVCENGGRIPNLSDIEGSMAWANKCDNGLVVTRNQELGVNKLISAKVRHEPSAGALGTFTFYIDSQTGIAHPRTAIVDDEPNIYPMPKRGPRNRNRDF